MATNGGISKVVHKLHAVTLIRSGIRQPWWEKRTLKALGLTKLNKAVIHKNTPAVNGLLRSVKHLIDVKPVDVVKKNVADNKKEDRQGTPVFLKANGQFDIEQYQGFCKDKSKVD